MPRPQSPFSLAKHLAGDAVLFGVGTILPSALTFLLVPLYTRVLAPAEMGLLNLTQSVVAVLVILAAAGIDSGIALVIAENRPDAKRVISAALLALLFNTIVVVLLGLGAGLWLAPQFFEPATDSRWGQIVLLGVLMVPFRCVSGFCMGLLKWRRRAGLFAGLAIVTNLLVLLLVGSILLAPEAGILKVLGAFLVAYGSAAVIVVSITARTECARPPAWSELYGVVSVGLPFLVAGLFEMVLPVLNRAIVAQTLGLEAVGILAAGWSLGYVLSVGNSAFTLAYQPLSLAMQTQNPGDSALTVVARWYLTLLLVAAVALAIWARPLVHLVLGGGDYREAFAVLPAFLFAVWLTAVRVCFEMGLVAARRTTKFIQAHGIACVVGALAAWIGSEAWGIMGAAWAVAAAEAILAFIIFRAVQICRPGDYNAQITVRLAGLFVLGALCLAWSDSNGLRAILWAILTIAILFGSGGIRLTEWQSLFAWASSRSRDSN